MAKFLYTVFIGLLLATSIGMGIAAFYAEPKAPEYPVGTTLKSPAEPTPADLEEQKQLEAKQKAFQKEDAVYNRNVALLAVGFSLAILILSLLLLKATHVIADGMMLGGVFTLIYGIIRSFSSGEQRFMFIIVTFSLVVAVVLGYIKFIRHQTS